MEMGGKLYKDPAIPMEKERMLYKYGTMSRVACHMAQPRKALPGMACGGWGTKSDALVGVSLLIPRGEQGPWRLR